MEIKEQNLQDATQVEKVAQEQPKELSKEEQIAKQFAPYANMSEGELKNNQAFLRAANEVVNEALSNLPTAKFLKQVFEEGATNSLYSEVINKLFGDYESVEAGQGVEYCLTNGMTVGELDENAFVPDRRNDVDNYTYWDSISLPDKINQIMVSASPWKYIKYFLSGKIDPMIQLVVDRARESMDLKQYYDAFALLKTIFAKVYAEASSTKETPSAHLVGTKSYIVDSVKEMKDFVYNMYNHNKQFAINKNFQGYNNLMMGDEVYICEIETYNNIKKVAMTFLAKDEFLRFTDESKWVFVPKTIYNANTGAVEPLNIFVDTVGNRVEGAVMVLGKSGLKRLSNLRNAFSEFYPNNLTTVHWFNARYTQGILGWTQVAVYNNAALEQDFVLPTETKGA